MFQDYDWIALPSGLLFPSFFLYTVFEKQLFISFYLFRYHANYSLSNIPIFNIIQFYPLLFANLGIFTLSQCHLALEKTVSHPVTIRNQRGMKSGMNKGCCPLCYISRLSYCLHYLHIVVLPDG